MTQHLRKSVSRWQQDKEVTFSYALCYIYISHFAFSFIHRTNRGLTKMHQRVKRAKRESECPDNTPVNGYVELYKAIKATGCWQECFLKAQGSERKCGIRFLGTIYLYCASHALKTGNGPISAQIVKEVKMIPVPSCLCKPIKFILLSFSRAKSP